MRPVHQLSLVLLAVFAIGWTVPARLLGQCPQTSEDVHFLARLYEKGQFDSIVNLGVCISELFEKTRPEKKPKLELLSATENFFRLYIQTTTTLGRNDLAESAMDLLLKRFPEFHPDPEQDPLQMIQYLDSLVAYPKNHLGVFAGPSFCYVQLRNPSPLYYDLGGATDNGITPGVRHRAGYQFGAEWSHYFGYRHSFVVGLGAVHATHAFTYELNQVPGENSAGDWKIIQRERTNFLQLPLQYQYRIRLDPHHKEHTSWLSFRAGLFGSLRLHSETELETTSWLKVASSVREQTEIATIGGMSERRVRWAGGLQLGLSYQMNFSNISWYIRGFAQYGLTQMRKSGSEYAVDFQPYLWNYHIGDNNFNLHSLNLVGGLMIPSGNAVKNLHKNSSSKEK
ncbi:MAG: hypothetical protein RLZZ519_1989 [Bacteroidota bacterium]|jgi:hypothetical protein